MNRWRVAAATAAGFVGGAIAGVNRGDPWVFWCLVVAASCIVLGILLGSFEDVRRDRS